MTTNTHPARSRHVERIIMSNAAPITPVALATELNVDPKRLRAFLRANHARPADAKNTSWALAPDVADACRVRFAPKTDA